MPLARRSNYLDFGPFSFDNEIEEYAKPTEKFLIQHEAQSTRANGQVTNPGTGPGWFRKASFLILSGLGLFILGSCSPILPSNRATAEGTSIQRTSINQALCNQAIPLNALQKAATKTNVTLPLQPPFRILQVGRPRSGSTFQFHLLGAITQLKNKDLLGMDFNWKGKITREKFEDYGESFLYKTHHIDDEYLVELHQQGELVIFSSGLTPDNAAYNVSMYNQDKHNLERCAECEVDHYQALFGLTHEEVNVVKNYLRLYSILRRCCGLQASHFEMSRLHGCTVTDTTRRLPEYPYCELVNKEAVEQEMMRNPITYRPVNAKINWAQPGDCAKFDKQIANGMHSNGKRWNGQC
jgi:hypothetical protein